jgi:hypothetical protein
VRSEEVAPQAVWAEIEARLAVPLVAVAVQEVPEVAVQVGPEVDPVAAALEVLEVADQVAVGGKLKCKNQAR